MVAYIGESTGLRSGQFRGHKSNEIKSGVSLCSSIRQFYERNVQMNCRADIFSQMTKRV